MQRIASKQLPKLVTDTEMFRVHAYVSHTHTHCMYHISHILVIVSKKITVIFPLRLFGSDITPFLMKDLYGSDSLVIRLLGSLCFVRRKKDESHILPFLSLLFCCFHDNRGREYSQEGLSQWRWLLFGWLYYWGQWN